mgnify:CR=1 FL=1|tara:strand:- start:3638 stop:3868 length:231 start_codon:yes stop_codon:yes gene_type:complete
MILTTRELLQLSKRGKLLSEIQTTETCTNYYAELEDGVQYKPRHHTTHAEAYRKAMARRNGRNFEVKQRILAGDNS